MVDDRPLDESEPAGSRTGRPARLGAIALLLAVAACGSFTADPDTAPGRMPTTVAVRDLALPAGTPQTSAPAAPRARPLRVRVPAVSIDAPLTALALDREGRLVPPPPRDRNLAGWYAAGTSPGQKGTAIVTGHIDTPAGPAVFAPLGGIALGDLVLVDRNDGHTLTFTVHAVETHPKKTIPPRVYAAATRPELRLITCAGSYRRDRGGYPDNLVVYAHLIPTKQTPLTARSSMR